MRCVWIRVRGFALIELLLVVVVIAILAGSYFNRGGNKDNSQSTYERSMDQSKSAACVANRAALRTSIQLYQMQNPGKPVTTENLQKGGISVPQCPDGGSYGFLPDGQLVCSKHK